VNGSDGKKQENEQMKVRTRKMLEDQGIYIRDKEAGKKIAAVFPGHGAQYPGMFRELYRQNDVVRDSFDRGEKVYRELSGKSLLDVIFSEDRKKGKQLGMPVFMQPAIVLSDLAVYCRLQADGFQPDFLLGHSLGEIAALGAAGCCTLEEAVKIAYLRAKAVETIPKEKRGGMISVGAPYSDELARRLMEAGGEGTCVSIINSSSFFNLSGPEESIQKIQKYCAKNGLTGVVLKVSHAFHSPLMESAVEPYRKSIRDFVFQKPSVPVYSTILGRVYEDEWKSPEAFADILARQLITPFRFDQIIRDLCENRGVGYFVESGPGNILTKLIQTTLADQCYAVCTNHRKHDDRKEYEAFSRKMLCYYGPFGTKKLKEQETKIRQEGRGTMNTEEEIRENVIGIISRETMYPKSVFQDSDKPVIRYYAITAEVGDRIFADLEKQYSLRFTAEEKEKLSIRGITEKICAATGISAEKTAGKTRGAADAKEIHDTVRKTISESTGYPESMLADDLDFEADLGIDSVKQGEILSSLQARFGYETGENEEERELNTISDVVQYLTEKMPGVPEEKNETAPEETPKREEASREDVKREVISVISELTGYPEDMLEEDLDLEADLGIDSVKQGEILSRLKEKYPTENSGGETDVKTETIRQLIDFVTGSAEESVTKPVPDGGEEYSLRDLSEQPSSRYLPVSLERELRKDEKFNLAGKNVLLIEDSSGGEVTQKLGVLLEEAGAHVFLLRSKEETSDREGRSVDFLNGEEILDASSGIHKEHPISVVINLRGFLPPLDAGGISEEEFLRQVKEVYCSNYYSAKAVYETFEQDHKETGYFAVTSVGGVFGLEKGCAGNPAGAAADGFVKGLEKELRPLHCKVLDFPEQEDSEWIAKKILEEISWKEFLVEAGYFRGKRKVIEVIPKEIEEESQLQPLDDRDVILVTGGGRGIVCVCVKALLRCASPRVIITGRTSLPEDEDPVMTMSDAEFESYRQKFFEKMREEHPEYTPVQISREYERKNGQRLLFRNLEEFRKSGADVRYEVCDACKPEEVRNLVRKVKNLYPGITGIINGAGLPSFGKIPKKDAAFAEKVVELKANSFYTLFRECQDQPLKFFYNMGSISGRFGMDGQVDYSAGANLVETLSFWASDLKDDTRFCTLEWSAWDQVGMAAGEQVKKIQQEKRGLEYLSLEEGTARFLNELFYGGDCPEVLFFGKLGESNLPKGQLTLLSDDHKTIARLTDEETGLVNDPISFPMLTRVVRFDSETITAEKNLTLEEDVHLADHLVEGKHVFAGVMHIETACELVRMFLALNHLDDYRLTVVRNFRFDRFIKVFPGNPLTLTVTGKITSRKENTLCMHVEFRSDFVNRMGVVVEKDRFHSCGDIYAERSEAPGMVAREFKTDGKKLDLAKYYRSAVRAITFGDSFRCVRDVTRNEDGEVDGIVDVPRDGQYLSYVRYARTCISPVTVDCIGRPMLFREYDLFGYTVVPTEIRETHIYRRFGAGEVLKVHCKVQEERGKDVWYSACVTDEENNVIFDIAGMKLTRIDRQNGDHALCEADEAYSSAV
jgi:acyl carrier protein